MSDFKSPDLIISVDSPFLMSVLCSARRTPHSVHEAHFVGIAVGRIGRFVIPPAKTAQQRQIARLAVRALGIGVIPHCHWYQREITGSLNEVNKTWLFAVVDL
jgi:hypothetical protein